MSGFPERLKELRIQNKVSQKEIANNIETSESLFQKYEYGKTKPAYDVIIKLCNYFNVSADYLLGLSDDPTRR